MTVLFAGQQIPKSPFEVNVDKALGDASKVTVKGPGIEPVGNIANKPTYFDIYTAGELHRPAAVSLNRSTTFWLKLSSSSFALNRSWNGRRDNHDPRPTGPPEQRGGDDGG